MLKQREKKGKNFRLLEKEKIIIVRLYKEKEILKEEKQSEKRSRKMWIILLEWKNKKTIGFFINQLFVCLFSPVATFYVALRQKYRARELKMDGYDAIVCDFGSQMAKTGFCGENCPRSCFPVSLLFFTLNRAPKTPRQAWTKNQLEAKEEQEKYPSQKKKKKTKLAKALHFNSNRLLLVAPMENERLLLPTTRRYFFLSFSVSSVFFSPSNRPYHFYFLWPLSFLFFSPFFLLPFCSLFLPFFLFFFSFRDNFVYFFLFRLTILETKHIQRKVTAPFSKSFFHLFLFF